METNNLQLDAKIEALLFYKGEPVSFKSLARTFEVSEEEVRSATLKLKESLSGRGLTLVMNEQDIMLGTTPELSSFFEEMRKEELTKELSRASLETLSVILYKDSVTRSDIDHIRGVNSSFILRNLQIRGLIDKKQGEKDSRVSVYSPSLELLSHLGVSGIFELPDYESVRKTLEDKIDKISDENISE